MDASSCRYCHGEIPAGAVKCRSCGEWIDARWRLGGTGSIVVVALIALELVAMIVMAVHWIPAFSRMYRDLGSAQLPALTRWIVAGWWMPAWIVAMHGLVLLALAGMKRIRARHVVLSMTLVIGGIALAITLWGLYEPVWALAGAIQG